MVSNLEKYKSHKKNAMHVIHPDAAEKIIKEVDICERKKNCRVNESGLSKKLFFFHR